MYHEWVDGERLAFDPEGLLSTIPSIAHVLVGYCCGLILIEDAAVKDKALKLFVVGGVLTFAGLLLGYSLPVNKKIWSPTFVLATCGMASTLLSLLICAIDIKGKGKAWWPAEVFGVNPLALYVLSDILAILLGTVCVGGKSLGSVVYGDVLCAVFPSPHFASLVFALLFVALNWLAGYFLYCRRIYIKV